MKAHDELAMSRRRRWARGPIRKLQTWTKKHRREDQVNSKWRSFYNIPTERPSKSKWPAAKCWGETSYLRVRDLRLTPAKKIELATDNITAALPSTAVFCYASIVEDKLGEYFLQERREKW